jgi:hypothetical protein
MKNKMTNIAYLVIGLISLLSFSRSIGINDFYDKILSSDSRREQEPQTPSKTTEVKETQGFDNSECDLISEGPICLFNGDRILLPYAAPKGLVGYWNFDEVKPLDNSGNRNHGIGNLKSGAAFGGFGSSALLTQGDYITIPHNAAFKSNDYTVTFWLFVVQDFFTANKGVKFCPLIQRGKDDLFSKTYQRSPALYYDRKVKNFKFYVKTNNEEEAQGESLQSNARVTTQRWLHIAMVKTDNKIKLYVNGILDSQMQLKGNPEINTDPLYIGNVPWLKDQCDFPFMLDELRYYNVAIEEDKIQAEASPILGGVEPSFLQLGCMNCSLKDASQSCTDGYKLCTSIELHTGGYQIARSMGWLNWNTHIWTHGAIKNPSDFEKLNGLALCCSELK